MLSLQVLSVVLLIASAPIAISKPAKKQAETVVKIIRIPSGLSSLQANKPGELLIPLTQHRNNKGSIRYTLGQRSSHDRLVSQASKSLSWSEPQNIQLRLEYPASGTGALITYVEINVNQSSNSGRAYVVEGGIGERRIVIMVEAYDTYWFSFSSRIYGV